MIYIARTSGQAHDKRRQLSGNKSVLENLNIGAFLEVRGPSALQDTVQNAVGKTAGTGEAVNILRGPAEKVVLMQQIMDRTGAYASLEAEILETIDGLSKYEELARKIAPKFIPPDQGEIDRTLLD